MKKITRKPKLGLILLLIPVVALAWWNNDWTARKQLTLDTGATGADIQETLSDFPLLLRLHLGNFGYFAELAENGKDLRFILDDKASLNHYVDKIDVLAELGLVWVKLPTVRGGVSTDTFAMYYGNANAADASDPKGIYDANQALVFHFSEGEALPQDATAYAAHAAASKAVIDPAGWIGAAAKFDGQGGITVNAAPALAINPDDGWTFSAWVKIDQAQQNAALVQAKDTASQLELVVQGAAVSARWRRLDAPVKSGNKRGVQGSAANVRYPGADGAVVQTAPANLSLGQWQHLAVVAEKDKLALYLNGLRVADTAIQLAAMNPSLAIGSAEAGQGFIGLLDEVQIAKQARSADWIKLQFRSQSPDFTVVHYGQDESNSAAEGPNYYGVILQSISVDGWVIITLCGAMFVISVLVMISKGLALKQVYRDNAAFLEQYRTVDASNPGVLDRDESEEEQEIGESEFLTAVIGKHDHFQSSPIYHVYHAGVHELKINVGDSSSLTPEALNLVRTRLDAAVVRETQKLNKNMVLLTLAIAGGPFLGLFGTVTGILLTFAAIAVTGEINIAAIAPGITGALGTTVAGLMVAIPTLFGYNYLQAQIKDVTADMVVFTDEFQAIIVKRVADRQQRGGGNLTVIFTDEFINIVAERIAVKQAETSS